ncbi:MAG: biopolymer transport protein ExbB [Psychromonas sp.]|jgi:biopolymer transport protein ExbB|uniref:MotA/TolQ/ExbB proton channel family protein n=1 Tax=Psychromonas sp. TaxID=1884585 RepID=UPI0039E3D37A
MTCLIKVKELFAPVLLLCLLFACFSAAAQTPESNEKILTDQLVKTTLDVKRTEAKHNRQRVAEFRLSEKQLLAKKIALDTQVTELQQLNDQLSVHFKKNEQLLTRKTQELHLAAGSLGELFGVVRQVAKDLQQEFSSSVSVIGADKDSEIVASIVAARTLPSTEQLTGLWTALSNQIKSSGQLSNVAVQYVDGTGVMSDKQVMRLGSMGIVDDNGYLNWQASTQQAFAYPVQPQSSPTISTINNMGVFAIDPSRGKLMAQLGNTPTWYQRIDQAGIVGKIIIAILALGLVIGTYRGSILLRIEAQIKDQLKTPEHANANNPLGRVLRVYKDDNRANIDALELRLLEAVMDEQQHLERGLSMLKLLAALAPMLGLLGTVTGMIDTFQTITQFGNADPRVMAGGISMALMTTVLGLITAMPLLLLHNVLSTQAENVRSLIEKQGVGLVAERAESIPIMISKAA